MTGATNLNVLRPLSRCDECIKKFLRIFVANELVVRAAHLELRYRAFFRRPNVMERSHRLLPRVVRVGIVRMPPGAVAGTPILVGSPPYLFACSMMCAIAPVMTSPLSVD